nr:DUF5695 domain-containing protein [Sphingomonas sp. Ant H11]
MPPRPIWSRTTFGWLAYGGNLTKAADSVSVMPKDGARARLFVAPAGTWITLEAGKIATARYTPKTGTITLTLDPATTATPAARLFVETTTKGGRAYTTDAGTDTRGGRTIPLSAGQTTVTLTPH